MDIINPVRAFNQAYVGDGGSSSDGVVILGGLLGDEWSLSGVRPTRLEVDRRTIANGNSTVERAYTALRTARIALEFEAARLQNVSPADPLIGRILTLAGYTYVAFAENWCSGVPLDDPDVGLATADLFSLAVTRFSEALASPIEAAFSGAANVGRARAQIGLGDFAGAAASAAAVPPAFVLNTTHSATAGEGNGIFLVNRVSRQVTLADAEGGNGLPFRSASDPRVPWTHTGVGFDMVTPQFELLKYTAADSPMPLATGTEARLIEAESLLRSGAVTGFLAMLNSLRTTIGLPAVTDPGTSAGRVDLLFEERAFWLVATGHRLGDLRRLIALYGRSAATEFPTGTHPHGGSYGTEANLPVPTSARGPSFNACTDRGS